MKFQLDHCMIRVKNLDVSLYFYQDILGMQLIRKQEYPDGKFTNVFLKFESGSAIELTYNWDREIDYTLGDAWGHFALQVENVVEAVAYLEEKGVTIKVPAKKMNHGNRMLAFVLDPDGHAVELVESIR